ncbi:MAG: hypothetical protein OK454_02705 [Thaumarchaeota archaeon]|nr:hypothetical protein [Nitrososphaerota archaeon]
MKLGRAQLTRQSRDFQDIVSGWVDAMRAAGHPDSYIALNYAAVRSWLKYNDSAPQWKPSLVVRSGTTVEDEQVPSPESWRRVLGVMDPPGRAAVLLLLSTGMRIGVLANRYSSNGLRFRDLPDFDIASGQFLKTPFLVRIPAELSKTKRRYATFGSAEAAEALSAYVSERVSRGEEILPESPVITVDKRSRLDRRKKASDGSVFLTEEGLSTTIKKALKQAIPKDTPRSYVTRAWCSTQLLLAEAKGLIARDFRESLLGHSLGVAGKYNLDKKWRADLVEEMRGAYRRCEPFLTTTASRSDATDPATISRTLLMGFGYGEAELAEFDLTDLAVVQELVAKKMGMRVAGQQNQKLVSERDLPRYLEEGWKVVTSLASNQVVLDPPALAMASRAAARGEPSREAVGL